MHLTTPLYRLYLAEQKLHFYTISLAERDDAMVNKKFSSEGIACYVFLTQAPNTVPLYRLAKQVDSKSRHLYTTSEEERSKLINPDKGHEAEAWVDEGVSGYIYSSKTDPLTTVLYRAHNGDTGDYIYTPSLKEYNDATGKNGYAGETSPGNVYPA